MIRQYNLVFEFDGIGKTINFEAENEFYADKYGRHFCELKGAKFISVEEIILH